MKLFDIPDPHPLKKTLKQHGISQWVLANKIGISQPLVSNYLNRRRPIPEDIEKIFAQFSDVLKKNLIQKVSN